MSLEYSATQEGSTYPHAPNNLAGQRQLPQYYPPPPPIQPHDFAYQNNGGGHGHNGGHNGLAIQPAERAHPSSPVPPPPSANVKPKPKGTRLHKACNACSKRKVKCDESGPPCKPCRNVEISCSFDRPTKRRGPPNKHAEAAKREEEERRRNEIASQLYMGGPPSGLVGFPGSLEPPSNTLRNGPPSHIEGPPDAIDSSVSTEMMAEALTSLSTRPVLNAEAICPLPLIVDLIEEFFTYIHPLAPFPHEPSFRASLSERKDMIDSNFLAMLASMIGALTASFPRKTRMILKAHRHEGRFPTSRMLISHCHAVAIQARQIREAESPDKLDVFDMATSYFLGLAAAYTENWTRSRILFGQTITFMYIVGAHKDGKSSHSEAESEAVDFVNREVARRIFWVMVAGVRWFNSILTLLRSLKQIGANYDELFMPPPTPSQPYPPFPLEIDDEFIFVDRILPQPAGKLSMIAGFNFGAKTYMSLSPVEMMEIWNSVDPNDWGRQKRILEDSLRTVKGILHNLPTELHLRPSLQPGQFESIQQPFFAPMAEYPAMQSNGHELGYQQGYDPRRNMQLEVQKANIYVSQLGSRSYIIEKYSNFLTARARAQAEQQATISVGFVGGEIDTNVGGGIPTSTFDEMEKIITQGRESIVQDLLNVLSSISQENMEPNGGSFVSKIRQIASTLLDQPRSRQGPTTLRNEEYLAKFIDILMKLEGVIPARISEARHGIIVDEEQESRSWADLREHQVQFTRSGGFMNHASR